MKKITFAAAAAVAMIAGSALAFEYNVSRPSDSLEPTFHAADTTQGTWSLAVDDVLAKAKAEGKYTLLMNTASWWCPFCKTMEALVLDSQAWKDYVAERGFFLAMMDFPYRGHVDDAQSWKSYRPDLGDGWGFKCWLMNPEYLAETGLSESEGLEAIMGLYDLQKKYALGTAQQVTIKRWDTKEDFTYGKLGYPTIIVFDPDGEEKGRASFPWMSESAVTQSEAQGYLIQAIERIVEGECEVCQDTSIGTLDVSTANEYNGWLRGEDGAICGLITVNTSKYSGHTKSVKVKASVKFLSNTIRFPVTAFGVEGCVVCGDELSFSAFTLEKGEYTATLEIGTGGLSGVFSDGSATYSVDGGLNFFKKRDAESKVKAATCPDGIWSIAVKNADDEDQSPFSRGIGALSLKFLSKGKARISGYLGNGSRVSQISQAVIGINDMVAVPFYTTPNSKRGRFGFIAWFKNGKLLSVDSIAKWVAAGPDDFESDVTVSFTMSPGLGSIPAEMELAINPLPETILGMPVLEDVSYDQITAKTKKWKGTSLSTFNVSVNSINGLFTGTMDFRLLRANGRERKLRGKVRGVVVGGAGYGFVYVKNAGTWAIRVALCGSCND